MADADDEQPGEGLAAPLGEAAERGEPVLVRRRSRRYKRFNRRRKITLVLVLLVVITVAQVMFATANLHGLVDKVRAERAAAEAGQLGAAEAYADSAHEQAVRANWGTWGPQFWLAEQLPWVGDNIRTARAVSSGARDLTGAPSDALFELENALGPEHLRVAHGSIDTSVFAKAHSAAERLDRALRDLLDQAGKVDTGGAVGGLKGLWSNYSAFLTGFSTNMSATVNAMRLAPDLLGASGARTYLVAILDNARLAPVGGTPVALMELTADHGRLTLGEAKPAAAVVGRITPSPDFPVTAAALAVGWQQHGGRAVDGVIALDPAALAAILKRSGSLAVSGQTITADTLIQSISNAAYVSLGPGAAGYQAALSHGVLDLLVRGEGNSGMAIRDLLGTVRDGHTLLWLRRADEEKALAGSVVLGQLASGPSSVPDVGVYLTAGSASAMDYYLQSNTTLTAGNCSDGRQTLTVATLIQSFVPSPVPTQAALLGANAPSGDIDVIVSAYGPWGGSAGDVVLNGERIPVTPMNDAGHPVVTRTVTVPKGGHLTVSWTFTTARGQTGDPVLRATPTATRSGLGVASVSACS